MSSLPVPVSVSISSLAVPIILPDERDYSVTDLLHVFLVTFQVFSEELLFAVHSLVDYRDVCQRDDE